MNRTILLILLLWFSYFSNAQIVIAPEAGIYYRPYLFRGKSNSVEQNKLDYYVGLMGEVKLMRKLYGQTRVSYIFRQSTKAAMEFTHLPDFEEGLYINKEMTFNVDLLFEPIQNTKIGLGIGMIHKLGSQVEEKFYYKNPVTSYFNSSVLYNMSVSANQNFGRFGMNIRCFYLFKTEDLASSYIWVNHSNPFGVTLGFNYRLFGHNNQK